MDLSKKINIIGDIDEVSYQAFVERMDECEEILEGDDIHIELSSHGGDAFMALAFYDRIRESKSNIIIKAYGFVASAAVLILAAGDKRYMAKSAWVMVHEDSIAIGEDGEKVSSIEKSAKAFRKIENQWNSILASRTKVDAEAWSQYHKEETYLSAKECLALGLIEGII